MATFPLNAVVSIAPGGNPVDPTGWTFTDITADVRESQGITIQSGRQDESSQVGPTSVGVTVDNRSGNYSRTNPLGAYYGLLDKGTPLSVAVTRINDTFTRSGVMGTEPNSGLTWTVLGSTWATTGSAATSTLAAANTANQVTVDAGGDDVDVTHTSSISAVTTGAAWVDATILRYVDDNNYYRLHCEFTTSGVIFCKIARVLGGVLTDLTANISTGVSYSAGTVIKTRARAIGGRLQVRAWLNSGSEPTTWTAEADDGALTGSKVGLYEWRVAGNTNAGSMTCTIDNYRSDAIRAVTPVPEWPVRFNQTGSNVSSPIIGAGILRRLSQGQSALRSPMYRRITGLATLRGYWPGEDASGATSMSSAYPGVAAAYAPGVSFAAADGPAGSDKLLTIATGSALIGNFPTNISSSGWQVQWTSNLLGADATIRQVFAWRTDNGYWWIWAASTTTYRISVLDVDGTVLYTSDIGNGGVAPGANIVFRMKCSRSGSTWTVEPGWYSEDAPVLVGSSGTFTGGAGRPVIWQTGSNAPIMIGAYIGHVFATTGVSESLQTTDMIGAINGYVDERAGDRLVRLSAEEGVPLRMLGNTADTALMGAQRPATYLDLVRECEEADQGTLFEAGAGLGYQTRVFRYGQASVSATPVMALDFAQGHIAAPPEPTDDDQRLRNRIILTRTSGGQVTAQADASIAKSGVYSDEITVNLDHQDDLDDHAHWRLHLGTLDDLRWPRIQLKLHANPSLIASWCKVRVGSRITIANPPGQVGTDTLDLIVEGWTETIHTFAWEAELVCSPAAAWQVGVYGDTNSRYDSNSTVLVGSLTTGGTSVKIGTARPAEFWSTTSVPHDVRVGGERMTVTAMGAVGSGTELISGAFETSGDITAWGVNASCTLALTATFVHSGSNAGLMTVTGSPTQAYIRPLFANCPAVVPGASYTLSVWVRSAVTLTDVRASIDWLDATGGYVSTSDSGAASLTSGSWVQRTVTATAPATAAYLQYGPSILSSPSAGTLLYVDDVTITSSTATFQVATLTRSVNSIVKTHAGGESMHLYRPARYAL